MTQGAVSGPGGRRNSARGVLDMVAAGGRGRPQGQGQESVVVYDGGNGDGEEAEVGAGCLLFASFRRVPCPYEL